MLSVETQCSSDHSFRSLIGTASLVRRAFETGDLSQPRQQLTARLAQNAADGPAMLDMAVLLQLERNRDAGLAMQRDALKIQRSFQCHYGNRGGLRVVAFVTAGDLMANTPIDFLLEQSNVDLILHYVDVDTQDLLDVPAHDVSFVAVGESTDNFPVLVRLEKLLASWPGAIMNCFPDKIRALTRDTVAELFDGDKGVLAPRTAGVDRSVLEAIASGSVHLSSVLPSTNFPILVRPTGTHAGVGLKKIDDIRTLGAYLEDEQGPTFFLSAFIDTSGKDGLFRKQRIAFVDGQAFASHLAISNHWMVHYLSADMMQHSGRREEEAHWMRDFDTDFAVRHAAAFDTLCRKIGLDYFAIDCAESPDGRLLLFEADVAMIVHAMDSKDVFPYKAPATKKLFSAFEDALKRRVERSGSSGTAVLCAHTNQPAVYQRTPDDCMICVLAMMAGRTYEEVIAAACVCDPQFPVAGPMSHSVMRSIANAWGLVMLSGIYMLWSHPGIVGVVSPTTAETGHAIFWDGEKIIDPGRSLRVDRTYVDRHALEFSQRACHLAALVNHDLQRCIAADTSPEL